jgi:hypothetical protein
MDPRVKPAGDGRVAIAFNPCTNAGKLANGG